ncbi:MAG: 7TM diverse intracellular signaling domain-containing protein [Bacteroidota bacterium]
MPNNLHFLHRIFLILSASLFLLLQWSCAPESEQPILDKGTLNLTTADFSKQPEILLQGESLFYWKQWPLDDNGDFNPSNLTTTDTITWPYTMSTGILESNRGFGTYRFFVQQQVSEKTHIIRMERALAALEVWINGKKIITHGKISKTAVNEQIDGRPLVIPLPNEAKLDVMLVFSNYKHRLGGGFSLNNTVQEEAYFTQKNQSKKLIEGIITFLILLFGAYQILRYFSFPQYAYFLYLGLFCLIGASRQLFVGEGLIYNFFPDISFEIVQKMRYVGYYGSLSAVSMYHAVLFPGYYSKRFIQAFVMIPIIGILYVLIAPVYYATFSAPIFQCYGLLVAVFGFYHIISAVRDKKPYAVGMLVSLTITCIIFLNDLLNAMLLIKTEYLINYGLLVYLGFQMILNHKIQKKTAREMLRLSQDIERMADRIEKKEKEITELRSETFQQLKSKEKLVENLKKVASNDDSITIENVIASLKSELLEDTQLTRIKNDIETLNQAFAERIKTLHPNLTATDIEICSYLRLSLDRKEIAKLRFTSVEAVRKSRYRLRKKLHLAPEDDLDAYVKGI